MKRPALVLAALGLVVLLALMQGTESVRPPGRAAVELATEVEKPGPAAPAAEALARPGLFDGRMFVAYYGTVGTPVLGVLGEAAPWKAMARVERAAAPFRRNGLEAQPVFELIVTIADAHPGADGDYSHDVPVAAVRRWVDAARTSGALLVLDIQTGLSDFPTVAKRWEWALREPHVGLAIDPEWRMERGQVPGRVIGSVTSWEMNLTTKWLDDLVVEHDLPQKLFLVHQFRKDMITGPHRWEDRPHLAEVQHVDGFGNPGQKISTYRTVARPDRFRMGFKLFYDEDVPRMTPAQVLRITPRVDFVSFQ